MKPTLQILALIVLAMLISACGETGCPEGTLAYIDDLSAVPAQIADSSNPASTTREIRAFLGTKTVTFDEVIEGIICNDHWSGTVYVTCDIGIPTWEEDAFFMRECPVEIDPDATVFVEAHRDKAYMRGCSCHE
jgi:hypothetical protein